MKSSTHRVQSIIQYSILSEDQQFSWPYQFFEFILIYYLDASISVNGCCMKDIRIRRATELRSMVKINKFYIGLPSVGIWSALRLKSASDQHDSKRLDMFRQGAEEDDTKIYFNAIFKYLLIQCLCLCVPKSPVLQGLT